MKTFFVMGKKRSLLSHKIFTLAVLLALVVQPVTPAFFYGGFFVAKAEAASAESSDSVTASDQKDLQETSVTEEKDTKTTSPEVTETPAVHEEVPASLTPSSSSEETAPAEVTVSEPVVQNEGTNVVTPETKDPAPEMKSENVNKEETQKESTTEPVVWRSAGDKATTSNPVQLGITYVAPQNQEVTVTFTKLPKNPGTLSIEEITLTEKQKEVLGSTSDKAYDITSSMDNGTFAYKLSLPIPKGLKNVEMKYASTVDELDKAKTVDVNDVSVKSGTLTAELNHFTVFVVTDPVLIGGACVTAGATSTSDCYDTIDAAVAASSDGDTIEIHSNLTTTSAVVVNKAVTIKGVGGTVLTTTGSSQLFTITANNVTIQDLIFNKLDKTSQHFIGVQASNVTIANNSFQGQFILGESDVVRALVVSGGVTNLQVTGNSFTNVRQPAYINNGSSGIIANNYVTGTKGWVVEKASDFTFTGNAWGSNSNGSIPLDIAIIPGSDPASTPNNYTCQIPALQSANNNAAIEDQYPSVLPCPDVVAPAVPNLVSPANGAAVQPAGLILDWTDVTDPSNPITYYYQSSYSAATGANNGFTSVLYGPAVRTTSDIDASGSADGTYYWQVRACDNVNNCSDWSGPWAVTVDGGTPPSVPGQIGWTTENPPVGSDYTVGSDFANYKTCGASLNSSPITNLWEPSIDASGVASYEREVYSPDDSTLVFAHSLTSNYVNGGGAVDGQTYWVRIRAVDIFGNTSAWTPKCAITYDVTAPSVPTNGLPNGTVEPDNEFDFTWDASTDNVPGTITYEYQASQNPAQSGGVLTTGLWHSGVLLTNMIHSSGAPDGVWYWQVRAKDSAGNVSDWSEIWNMAIDSVAPAVPTHVSPTDNTYTTSSLQTTIDWTDVADPTSPVSYQYQASNSNTANLDGSFTTPVYTSGILSDSEIPTPGTPEGVYYWHVRAQDGAGHWSAWSTPWKITVDNTAPTVDLVFPTPGPTATSFQAVFSEDVNEAEAENGANYFLNNWPGAGGSGDLNGDVSIVYDAGTKTATVQMTNPGWYVSAEQEWGVQNIHDLAGNVQAVNPYTETSTAMIAPVTTDSGTDANWHNTSVTVTLSCEDGPTTVGSGCKTTYYTLDGSTPTTSSAVYTSPLVISAEGITTIKYFSIDNAGNIEAVKTAANTVKIDTTNPGDPTSVSSTSHTPGVWSGDGTVDVAWSGATDNLSGVDGFYTEWNNSPDTINGPKVKEYEEAATSETSPLFASGQPYYFHIATLDNAGNWTSTAHLGPFQIDRTNPTITWTDPSSVFSYVGGAAVNLAVTAFDAHSGVQNVTFAYSPFLSFTWVPIAVDAVAPYATTWDTTSLSDGIYTLRAMVRDNVNRTAQSFRLVITDNTDPTTTDSGTDANWHTTDVTVTLSCSDGFLIGSGCDTTYYTTDGSDPTTASAIGNTVVVSAEGVTTIKYFSTDNVGNEEAVKTAANTVKIDKTAPTVALSIDPVSPDGDNNWYTSHPDVTLTANDATSGVDHIEYRLNGGSWTTYSGPFALADGIWTVDYRAFDVAGNESAMGTVANVKVDTQNPDEVNNLDAEYRQAEDDIKLTWDVDDNDIDRVFIYRGSSSTFNISSGNRIGINDDTDDTFSDNHPELGHTYYYKLVSVDEAGNHSGANTIRVKMPDEAGGTATVTSLGTEPVAEGTVLGAETNAGEEGPGGTNEEVSGAPEGEILGASTANPEQGTVNGFTEYVKNHPWLSLLWLLIFLGLGYGTYKYTQRKQIILP